MEVKPVEAVAVTSFLCAKGRSSTFFYGLLLLLMAPICSFSQQDNSYQPQTLEAAEVQLLFSYYGQDGSNAAVTGGEGSEKLTDATSSVVVTLPLNASDILTVDVGISAYTSASSSNINPLDGDQAKEVSPFSASSGASRSDMLIHLNPEYQHTSKDGNNIWGVSGYFGNEFDYTSLGFGGNYAHLFNDRNTEVSAAGQVYLDTWNPQYPIELREGFFDDRVTGPGTYAPNFVPFADKSRNSYSVTLGFSQIISKRLQGSLSMDLVTQQGLLSTPFQRIYFADSPDFFIDDFQLADDVERLPDSRFKLPIGGRLNYFLNDVVVLRTYYRFYYDDWGITSHTAELEVPLKISDKFTLYPSYRYYTQTAADYFYPKEEAVSSLPFYTSDYDLSPYSANQYGFGVKYKDIFTRTRVLSFGLKALNFRFAYYKRDTGLDATIFTLGTTFVAD